MCFVAVSVDRPNYFYYNIWHLYIHLRYGPGVPLLFKKNYASEFYKNVLDIPLFNNF